MVGRDIFEGVVGGRAEILEGVVEEVGREGILEDVVFVREGVLEEVRVDLGFTAAADLLSRSAVGMKQRGGEGEGKEEGEGEGKGKGGRLDQTKCIL